MKKILFHLSLLILFCNCTYLENKTFSELEKFDNSLDSLISEPVFDYSKYLVLHGDTLKNNPKKIEETCYIKTGSDSILVNANCHIYTFENNEVIFHQTKDDYGNEYVHWNIYFKDKIDNKLISNLQKKYTDTDTIVVAYVKKYNKDGKLLKLVHAYNWFRIGANYRKIKTTEIRMLDISNYNQNNNCIKWRKEYVNAKYDIDTIKAVPIRQFNIDCNIGYDKDSNYLYTYDEYGNWIVKKRMMIPGLAEGSIAVYSRKITY